MRFREVLLIFGFGLALSAEAGACLEVVDTEYEAQQPVNGYAEVAWAAELENRCENEHDVFAVFELRAENGRMLAKDLAAAVAPPGKTGVEGRVHVPERELPRAAEGAVEIDSRERPH